MVESAGVIWTEDLLIHLGGWEVMKEARALRAAGRVRDANWKPPVLRGTVAGAGKSLSAGFRATDPRDIENLCPCRDSRARGIICAHSVAVGLEWLFPSERQPEKNPILPAISPKTPRISSQSQPLPSRTCDCSPTDEIPSVRFSFEGSWREIRGRVDFLYQAEMVANRKIESEILTEIGRAGFVDQNGEAVLRGENVILRFFGETLPRWSKHWEVSVGERFSHVSKNHLVLRPNFQLRPSSKGSDWLDFRAHFTAGSEALLSASDLQNLLAGGQNSISLRSGKTAVVDQTLLADLEEVLRDCNPDQEGGAWRIRHQYAGYLQSSIEQWRGESSARKPRLPLGPLGKQLRPYQREGAGWMLDLARSGQGGLLADEMGLGKTVQTLAMLEQLPGPSLVVCPSSLVWNWRKEATRFCPQKKVLALEGPNRKNRFALIHEHDLVLTSYALLRRDLEAYLPVHFSAIVLDEAQHIKNPQSQNAAAARRLHAASRFVLTGTPVENSLQDLWSLFAFLLPGYLGPKKDFFERYEVPLQAGKNPMVWGRLKRRIAPFYLRRRKASILPDLPDKIEQVVEVELTTEQKRAYDQMQQEARRCLDDLQTQSGGAARMRALTALLRLRQICCDIRLLGVAAGTEDSSSVKLTTLLELLEEAMDGEHRVLVFSQFTSMLDLISRMLEKNAIAHVRLDGTTKNREMVVEQFQNDPTIPVFLISLKAGGTGLNLTGADTVIHFDPWWNPAVEAQATDRAHRIGQKQVVTSIKLVTRDTIEDKILHLQKEKAELLASTLDEEAAWQSLQDGDLAALLSDF